MHVVSSEKKAIAQIWVERSRGRIADPMEIFSFRYGMMMESSDIIIPGGGRVFAGKLPKTAEVRQISFLCAFGKALLVNFDEGRSLFDMIALKKDLEELLGRKVDVVTEDSACGEGK